MRRATGRPPQRLGGVRGAKVLIPGPAVVPDVDQTGSSAFDPTGDETCAAWSASASSLRFENAFIAAFRVGNLQSRGSQPLRDPAGFERPTERKLDPDDAECKPPLGQLALQLEGAVRRSRRSS
jgi:hypothetical protein